METPPIVIRAKLKVDQVTRHAYGAEEVKFSAVCSGSEENRSFSEATPTANLSMTITNKGAHGFFIAGKEYLLDFKPAE